MGTVIFWFFFTVLGIWFQAFFPGIRFFAPAVVFCLHIKENKTAVILGIIWILLEEGSSVLAFGTSLLFYPGLIAMFYQLRTFLAEDSPFFIIVLFVFTGFWNFVAIFAMVNLQELIISYQELFLQSAASSVTFLIVWLGLSLSYLSWTRKKDHA